MSLPQLSISEEFSSGSPRFLARAPELDKSPESAEATYQPSLHLRVELHSQYTAIRHEKELT